MYGGLTRPKITPHLDKSHPCSDGVNFAAVSFGGQGMVDIILKQSGTLGSTPLLGVDVPYLGPAQDFNGNINNTIKWTNRIITSSLTNTFAAFFNVTSLATIIKISGTGLNTGLQWAISTAGQLQFGVIGAGFTATSTFTTPIALNIPYFAAIARPNITTSAQHIFILKRLDTGQVQFSLINGSSSAPAPDGTIPVGITSNIQPFNGNIAAVLHSTKSFSLSQLYNWSESPWSVFLADDDAIINAALQLMGVPPTPPSNKTFSIPLRFPIFTNS